jgi:hypothetical protein
MLSNKYGPENAKTVVIAVALFFGVSVAFSSGGDNKHAASAMATASSAQPDAFPDPRNGSFGIDVSVCVAPQMEVEDRLKSPGSGSFEVCRILSVSPDHKTVVIAGSVTATNSFNAKIRTAYTATLVKKPDAKPGDTDWNTWRVASLAFD